MSDPLQAIEEAIDSVGRLRARLSKENSAQVRARDQLDLMKVTALTWLNSQRAVFGEIGTPPAALATVDGGFVELLEMSARHSKRERCKGRLKTLRSYLVALRTDVVSNPKSYAASAAVSQPPDWSVLVPDTRMQAILARRWHEIVVCMRAGAHLAATVMMGALLEALFLARVVRLQDKTAVFNAKTAPKDRKSGKTAQLQDWSLNDYIAVAHELTWIRQPARDVGSVLRDYRNFIHPAKELSQGVSIEEQDSTMFWVLFQSIAQQVSKIS